MKSLILLPLIASFVISLLPGETNQGKSRMKQVALIASMITLIEGIRV
jgi:NADH:ubiquinone oxidoreductase subunit 4 (subunit M)